MKILGVNYKIEETFDSFMTVADSWVVRKNKIGKGNGEAKLYVASKDAMREFYGKEGFSAHCFVLKSDLINYMYALKNEYMAPSQPYRHINDFPALWQERMDKINKLGDRIDFDIDDQIQIEGERGYVKSTNKGYKLLRELSLPLVSYLSAIKLENKFHSYEYYWKLFADFDAIEDKSTALVYTYGNKEPKQKAKVNKREESRRAEISNARLGQGKYREQLLEECPSCPITGINDERLLIASHIKPWVASNDDEKIDPKNGYMLSPLYDKLFDRGFITFTDKRKMVLSDWLSPKNIQRMGLKNGEFFQKLPMDAKRQEYLQFHYQNVFHGVIE